MGISGILNVDKPYGITSMELVRRVKRASHQKRVGHTGTLDPIATGVLPICLGQATRMMEYLVDDIKIYRTVVELGVNTDTYDALGKMTSRTESVNFSRAEVTDALMKFKDINFQVPPMFSALKKEGKRLYDLARAGIEVERKPRSVEVFDLSLIDWEPPLVKFDVTCGRGFYVRSLAYDLGVELKCGGHLKNLVRLKSGPFHQTDSVPLEEIEKGFKDDDWMDFIYNPDHALYKMKAAIVSGHTEKMIRDGRILNQKFGMAGGITEEKLRVYTEDGRFIGIIIFDSIIKSWRPHKVFSFDYLQPNMP